ncbi:hypothetical protein QM012_007611 [Aureobasidium pullulans]|uniref:Uncharacterized protein n=1 Tax=Aureobasidium pullulans TaxID=5580 RepID=A0ABR0TK88_AURPU
MASFLLFCVSQVPISVIRIDTHPPSLIDGRQTINQLLQTPEHNFFSLVRNSTQTTFDSWCTPPPVHPYVSDFQDREQIRSFIAAHLGEPPSNGDLEPCQYAVLDERSATDQTMILAHSYSAFHMRDPETMTDEECVQWEVECDERADEPDDSWRKWRVRFEDAGPLSTHLCFETDFTPKLYNDDLVAAHTDQTGVFQLTSAWKAYVDANS